MEKHLDDLAATVHKLLAALSPTPIPHPTPIPPPPPPAPHPSPSSNRMWIGIAAAVVLLAAVLVRFLLRHHRRAEPQRVRQRLATTGDGGSTTTQAPQAHRQSRRRAQTVRAPINRGLLSVVQQSAGCHPLGSLDCCRSISGRWLSVNPSRQAYELTWQQPKDTLTVAPDQLSLSGTNSYDR